MYKFLFQVITIFLVFGPEDSHAIRTKQKTAKSNNSVTVKVIAMERNSKAPVYKGRVTIVGFSGTKEGETDANGVFQAEFPGNDTVAASIKGAVGYRDTTTKAVSIRNKEITLYAKMRRNNKEEPLSPPRPTNTPVPPTIPTIQPTYPYPTPTPYYPGPYPTVVPYGPPIIYQQPKSEIIVYAGQRVNLSIGANGSGMLTYQWMQDGIPIPNAKKSTYSFSTEYGIYPKYPEYYMGYYPEYYMGYPPRYQDYLMYPQKTYRINCIVSNEYGSVESSYSLIRVSIGGIVSLDFNNF